MISFPKMYLAIYIFVLCQMLFTHSTCEKVYSMIKEINNIVYVGGNNMLASYKINENKELQLIAEQNYTENWPNKIMNGSDIGFEPYFAGSGYNEWPHEYIKRSSKLYAFDNCLNWLQDHPNDKTRNEATFDFNHQQYHTPSGDWLVMDFICQSSFIRSVELLDEDKLWVCGSFGSFPRAFSVDKTTLKFIKFVDNNLMSCARYLDDPIVTFKDHKTGFLYVGSERGLYRPDKTDPDVPNNNSTMMYTDWRPFRNLFTLTGAMSWVLSSDVSFINVVHQTSNYLYFFGHEINSQYGLNNQEDRNAWQSFMVRLCRDDLGFKHKPNIDKEMDNYLNNDYFMSNIIAGKNDYYDVAPKFTAMAFNNSWVHDVAHLPTKHFVTPIKINFGCYMGRRPRAISDNHFTGDTNVVYLNKLADAIFNPERQIKFKTKNTFENLGCKDNAEHSQIPLIGIFNRPGLADTAASPVGALCQLQINENIFIDVGSNKKVYHPPNIMKANNSYDEVMILNSMTTTNFYSKSVERTNGYTVYKYLNQGVVNGAQRQSYLNAFSNIGKCHSSSFYQKLTVEKFQRIMNFTNTGWPNELPNRLTSPSTAVCQYSAAELYSFNATFVVPGVEFKRIFLVKDNIVDYVMHPLNKENPDQTENRLKASPLMVVMIVSTSGQVYRVVLCDFDSAMDGRSKSEWYDWCIFRNTDQPYLYRQYFPMEKRDHGHSYLFRASSLLHSYSVVSRIDLPNYPINRDPQTHIVKDVIKKDNLLLLLSANNISFVSLHVNCSTYSNCVECASDPFCMWHLSEAKCISYSKPNYIVSEHIQDVLDRGFKCIQGISVDLVSNISTFLRCSNSKFWRGRIIWKENDAVISANSNDYLLNERNDVLALDPSRLNKNVTFSCYGVREDYDKLYNNLEYSWLMEHKLSNEILLNTFQFPTNHSTVTPRALLPNVALASSGNITYVFIMIVIVVVVVASAFIVRFLIIRKRKQIRRCYLSNRSTDPMISRTTELSS